MDQWDNSPRRNPILKILRLLLVEVVEIAKYRFQNLTKTKHEFGASKITYHFDELSSEMVENLILWVFNKQVGRNSQSLLAMKVYYVPLYFSIYFIIYIGYLILKAISRHRIKIPASTSDTFLLFARKADYF